MLNLADPFSPEVSLEVSLESYTIGSMEIYQFNTNERASGLLKISSNGINGWETCILPSYGKTFDLIRWASVFIKLKGLSIPEALVLVRNKQEVWGQPRCELAESALQDLIKQVQTMDTVVPLKKKKNGIVLERAYLIDLSQSYYSF